MNNKGILDHHQQLVIATEPTVIKHVVKYYAKKKARVGTIAYALVPVAFFVLFSLLLSLYTSLIYHITT